MAAFRLSRSAAAALGMALAVAGPGLARPENDTASPRVPVVDGTATISASVQVERLTGGRYLIHFAFPETTDAPVIGTALKGPAAALLRSLYARGLAAGNHGDLYENRDRGHSTLRKDTFPQLTHVLYDDELKTRGSDYGAAGPLVFDAPTIGNSSTALTAGSFWRSQPRLVLTSNDGPARLWQNYLAGQLHVYPEHRDHDPEFGDLFPANTPYMLVSQGSSGSDRAHLQALAMILAAFRPETKAFLIERGLLAATVQMVYRRGRRPVLSRAHYFSALAHPSAFDGRTIAAERMVALANAIAPGDVPPLVVLDMVEETPLPEGADHPGGTGTEKLFDTPAAIARVWRSRNGRREMIVSAERTEDPNGRDLSFTWSLLRGDRDRVRIEPLDPEGRRARIVIDWQEPQPIPGTPAIRSSRVDIGVFASNGVYDSAPSFVTVYLPRHERRRYETGPDGAPRPVEIDREAGEGDYADPALFPDAPWRDVFHYDDAGRFDGWTRHCGETAVRFRADGTLAEGETVTNRACGG